MKIIYNNTLPPDYIEVFITLILIIGSGIINIFYGLITSVLIVLFCICRELYYKYKGTYDKTYTFAAINLCGVLFVRYGIKLSERLINHESIHSKQIKELWYIGFYLWYILEYIFRIFQYKFNFMEAYRNLSFEREAYDNENNFDYIPKRKRYEFFKYITKKGEK